jgi:hypothetical protein
VELGEALEGMRLASRPRLRLLKNRIPSQARRIGAKGHSSPGYRMLLFEPR